eukprot:m51a1_g9567 hypothetical protein (425) ;mRNA; f:916263-917537
MLPLDRHAQPHSTMLGSQNISRDSSEILACRSSCPPSPPFAVVHDPLSQECCADLGCPTPSETQQHGLTLAAAAPQRHNEHDIPPSPPQHHDALDTIAAIEGTLERQREARAEIEKELQKHIANLKMELSVANQRLENAKVELELSKKLNGDTQKELERAVDKISALTDRVTRDNVQICQMARGLESLNIETRKQTDHLNQMEAQRVRDAAVFQAKIKELEAEVEEAHSKKAEAETHSKQRAIEMASRLEGELGRATARIRTLSDHARVDDKRIKAMKSELAQVKGALDFSEHARSAAVAERDTAVAQVEQGHRLVHQINTKLDDVTTALKAEATRSAEIAAKARESEALALSLQAQLDAANHQALLPKPALRDENAKDPNTLVSQPVGKVMTSAAPSKGQPQYSARVLQSMGLLPRRSQCHDK